MIELDGPVRMAQRGNPDTLGHEIRFYAAGRMHRLTGYVWPDLEPVYWSDRIARSGDYIDLQAAGGHRFRVFQGGPDRPPAERGILLIVTEVAEKELQPCLK